MIKVLERVKKREVTHGSLSVVRRVSSQMITIQEMTLEPIPKNKLASPTNLLKMITNRTNLMCIPKKNRVPWSVNSSSSSRKTTSTSPKIHPTPTTWWKATIKWLVSRKKLTYHQKFTRKKSRSSLRMSSLNLNSSIVIKLVLIWMTLVTLASSLRRRRRVTRCLRWLSSSQTNSCGPKALWRPANLQAIPGQIHLRVEVEVEVAPLNHRIRILRLR